MTNFGLRTNEYGASWTGERIDQLKQLWASGLSCSQIASELGGVTRNAVIGKVHRLGLSGREKKSLLNLQRRGPRKPLGPRKPKFKVFSQPPIPEEFEILDAPSIDDMAIPLEQRKTLYELNENTCRFPIGDPQKPDFFFCGDVPFLDHPYCHAHCRVAYHPARAPVSAWRDVKRSRAA